MSEKRKNTRHKIVEAASQGFRSHGFAGIGVDAIANAAGVTSGAFYSHLGSKKGAFEAALNQGLDEVIEAVPSFQKQHGKKWLDEFINYYMSPEHRNNLESGCAMTTLSPEVVRTSSEIHEIYEEKMKVIIELMSKGLDEGNKKQKLGRAWSVIAGLIGGLTLSRAVNSEETIKLIRHSVTSSVKILAGKIKC